MAKKATFNAFKFIADAVSDDEARYFMTEVYYDKEANALVATDGRRLHMWHNPPFTSDTSTYVRIDVKRGEILAMPKDWQFPNYSRVIPAPNVLNVAERYEFTDFDADIPRFSISTGVAINCKYLRGLGTGEWSVKKNIRNPESRAVVFSRDDYTAVIMPMCID